MCSSAMPYDMSLPCSVETGESMSKATIILSAFAFVSATACTRNQAPEPVAPQNSTMKNSPIASGQLNEMTATVETVCYWNDKKYSDGAQVCESHQRHKCWNGKWVDIGNC